ncbi:VanZ family protein [Calothrix sp. PCC 6303]|uniref:VanZ family protein n=1 Tax=Calothrix sp. PCC 6303 TaxID=1170562 RepID=UPI0002A03D3F|nr:VanZ family protein [Calothrix sp. PCC 6303]AFZ03357.1 VanZ family protein [Calothrix sp. PCC 6303]
MRNPQNSSPSLFHRFSLDFFLVIFSTFIILFATLYPFNFYLGDNLSFPNLINGFNNQSFLVDQVNNVLLFAPLGFGIASILKRRKTPISAKLMTIIVISACLSASVEVLQLFLPSRTPTPADIMNNTIGGIVGLFCFYLWDSNSFISVLMRIENSQISRSFKRLNILLFTYIILAYLITIPWQYASKLKTWNPNFPLLIGNERTGDRPWSGYISNLAITNTAISSTEIARLLAEPNKLDNIGNSLITSYSLNQKQNYQDRTGTLPDLIWRGNPLENQEVEKLGTILTPNQWLESAAPATELTQKISATSEFTLITTIATTNANQRGPARIISLSEDTTHSNFVLGQEATDLILRLRTPLTGENGADIKLYVPGIFIDTEPHNIVVTYSQANVQIYVDNMRNYLAFNLLDLIPREQRLLLYAVTFIPLGFCLAFLIILFKHKYAINHFLIPLGILLPSLILETIIIHQSGKNISIVNISLGIFFTVSSTFILKLRTNLL